MKNYLCRTRLSCSWCAAFNFSTATQQNGGRINNFCLCRGRRRLSNADANCYTDGNYANEGNNECSRQRGLTQFIQLILLRFILVYFSSKIMPTLPYEEHSISEVITVTHYVTPSHSLVCTYYNFIHAYNPVPMKIFRVKYFMLCTVRDRQFVIIILVGLGLGRSSWLHINK